MNTFPKFSHWPRPLLWTSVGLFLLSFSALFRDDLPDQSLAYAVSSLAYAVSRCNQGDDAYCIRAGMVAFEDGDKEVAAKYFAQACRLRIDGDCKKLMDLDSFDDLQCQRGFPNGCIAASVSASEKGDFESEINYLDRACQLGSMPSCEDLAVTYNVGAEGLIELCDRFPSSDQYCVKESRTRQVRRNRKLAATYYDLACRGGGGAEYCYFLYHWYSDGLGVPRSPKRAAEYLHLACQLHKFSACQRDERD